MKRFLAALGWSACLLGQRAPEEAFFERVYGKLAASFAPGGTEFLLLAHPGVPLADPTPRDAAALADRIPLPAERYTPSAATYSTIYGNVLDQSETTSFQNMALRNQALLAQRVIWDRRRPGRPTPAYAAYLKYKKAHDEARDVLALAQAERRASGRPVPSGLEQEVAAALEDWENRGAKEDVEAAFATIRRVADQNLRVLFFNLRKEMARSTRYGGGSDPWLPVVAEPPVESWLDDAGWLPFAFSQKDREVASGGSALPPGPEGRGALPREFLSTASLTVETKRVSLSRGWLDEGIFESHGWRFFPQSGLTQVSTGNPADPDPGLMPMLVTGILLARNLRMEGAWGAPPTAELASAGPFALQGPWKADGDTLHTTFSYRQGNLTFVTEGVQVLGFFCKPVPKSPDPDAKAFRYP